jgi:hypothetical protein
MIGDIRPRSRFTVWIAPFLSFAMVICGGWFLVRYWQDAATSAALSLNPDTEAQLAPAGFNSRNLPTLQIANKGTIVRAKRLTAIGSGDVEGVGVITTPPFQCSVEFDEKTSKYEFKFNIRRESAFSGADLRLVELAYQLESDPVTRGRALPPQDLPQKLESQFGAKLVSPPLEVSPADLAAMKSAWAGFLVSTNANRVMLGAKVMDAIQVAGKAATPAQQPAFARIVTDLRKVIPAADEQKYRDNIRKATSRPAARAAANNPAARAAAPTTRRGAGRRGAAASRPATVPASQPAIP